MISVIASVLFCAAGHLVRDGWPVLGSTHLARACGGLLCLAAALVVTGASLEGLLFGAAILVGFYTDMKHGEGNNATTLVDAGYLALSGATSITPLALAAWLIPGGSWVAALAIPAAAILKPPVWFLARRINTYGLPYTRVAAVAFGAAVGAALGVIA